MKLAPLLLFLLFVLLANFGASIEAFECFGISSSNSSVCSGRGVCVVGNVCECYEGYSGPRCSRADGIVQSSILFGKFGSSGNFNYGQLSDPSGLSKSSLSSDLLVADANFLIRFNMDGKVVSKSASSGAAKFVELGDGSFLFFPSSGLYTYLMRSGKKLTTYINKQSNTLCYIYTLLYNSNDGFLYGTDLLNNFIFKIDAKNIDSSTELTCVPVAGIYGHVGFTEDKSRFANASLLFSPTGLILNQNNELVFSDMRNNRIRKITTDGYIVTLASNLNGPATLAFSPSGDLYFLEIGTKTIKRLDRRGVVSSLGEMDSMK